MSLSLCYESELKRQHKGSNTYPRTASVHYGGNGKAESIDGGRIQWREVVGGENTIRRPEEAEQYIRRLTRFEEISNFSLVGIYIPTLSH